MVQVKWSCQSPRASPQRLLEVVEQGGLPFQALQAKDLCTKMIEERGWERDCFPMRMACLGCGGTGCGNAPSG